MDEEQIPIVTGTINVDYHVYCPHCEEMLDDLYDSKWWGETFGNDFPAENSDYDQKYDAVCPKCNKAFIVDRFEH